MIECIFGSQLAIIDERLHERVIHGQLLNRAISYKVCPSVTDGVDDGFLAIKTERHCGRPHSSKIGIVAAKNDNSVSLAKGREEHIRIRFLGVFSLEVTCDCVEGKLRCEFTSGCTAHSIQNDPSNSAV
jgi:hypothetical protein